MCPANSGLWKRDVLCTLLGSCMNAACRQDVQKANEMGSAASVAWDLLRAFIGRQVTFDHCASGQWLLCNVTIHLHNDMQAIEVVIASLALDAGDVNAPNLSEGPVPEFNTDQPPACSSECQVPSAAQILADAQVLIGEVPGSVVADGSELRQHRAPAGQISADESCSGGPATTAPIGIPRSSPPEQRTNGSPSINIPSQSSAQVVAMVAGSSHSIEVANAPDTQHGQMHMSQQAGQSSSKQVESSPASAGNTQPTVKQKKGKATGRNQACPCGSHRKYKACCGKQKAGSSKNMNTQHRDVSEAEVKQLPMGTLWL